MDYTGYVEPAAIPFWTIGALCLLVSIYYFGVLCSYCCCAPVYFKVRTSGLLPERHSVVLTPSDREQVMKAFSEVIHVYIYTDAGAIGSRYLQNRDPCHLRFILLHNLYSRIRRRLRDSTRPGDGNVPHDFCSERAYPLIDPNQLSCLKFLVPNVAERLQVMLLCTKGRREGAQRNVGRKASRTSVPLMAEVSKVKLNKAQKSEILNRVFYGLVI